MLLPSTGCELLSVPAVLRGTDNRRGVLHLNDSILPHAFSMHLQQDTADVFLLMNNVLLPTLSTEFGMRQCCPV